MTRNVHHILGWIRTVVRLMLFYDLRVVSTWWDRYDHFADLFVFTLFITPHLECGIEITLDDYTYLGERNLWDIL